MGAAAFIMAEFLEVSYTTIVIAAIFPAILHYTGMFAVVHLMARKLDLKGLSKDMLPKFKEVWADGRANILPLIALLVILFSGYTPFMSALLIACSALATLDPQERIKLQQMAAPFEAGVKYALAVGAASAAVGIVVGVINTTGIGFRIGFMVRQGAGNLGTDLPSRAALRPNRADAKSVWF